MIYMMALDDDETTTMVDGSSDEAALRVSGMQIEAHRPWSGIYRIHQHSMLCGRQCYEHFNGGMYIYFDGKVWKMGPQLDPEATSDVYAPESSHGGKI